MKSPVVSRQAVALATLWYAGAALAQYEVAIEPTVRRQPAASIAQDPQQYRKDKSWHLYSTYSQHIYRGQLPPMLNAVMVTQTTLDAQGRVLNVEVIREPAQTKEAIPWVINLIREAGPYPAPSGLGSAQVSVREVWLLHRAGHGKSVRFQLDSLSEGQRSNPDAPCTATQLAQSPPTTATMRQVDKAPAAHSAVFSLEEEAHGGGVIQGRNKIEVRGGQRGEPVLGEASDVTGDLEGLGSYRSSLKLEEQAPTSARFDFRIGVEVKPGGPGSNDFPASASYLRIFAKAPVRVVLTSRAFNSRGSAEAFFMNLRDVTDPCTHVQSMEVAKRTAFPAGRPIRHTVLLPAGEHKFAWGVGARRAGGTSEIQGSLSIEAAGPVAEPAKR